MRVDTYIAAAIPAEVNRHMHLGERLLAEIPDIEPETLTDTLEGITDLREMLAEIIRSALDDESLAGGLSTRLSDMKARIERFETSARRKRELALRAMSEAEIPKLLVADFTASLRHGAHTLEVIEENKIPAAYRKPQPPKLDRLGLMAALKAGTAIEGATLAATQLQLSVRTK
jgi:Siphovirus Gp157